MYSSSSMLGQKLMSWMRSLERAETVDATETLDDAHRIPVDVVVDDGVAVLEVLALADAVGGDEQIEFAVAARSSGRSFERGEKEVMMLAKSLRRLGSVV
jgi:hypothetical protein